MLFPLAVSGIIRHTPSSGSRLSGLGRHGKSRLDLYIDNLNFGVNFINLMMVNLK